MLAACLWLAAAEEAEDGVKKKNDNTRGGGGEKGEREGASRPCKMSSVKCL